MSLDSKDLWSIYAEGIAKAAGLPSSPKDLILTGSALVANFAAYSKALPTVPTVPEALFEVYNLANTELNLNGIYHPSQAEFFNDYASYIDNLVPNGATTPTPTQQAQIKLLKGNLAASQTQLNKDMKAAFAAWKAQSTYFPGKYPTFQSFLNTTTWGATINTDSSKLSADNSALSTLYSKIYGKNYVAIQLAKQTVDNVRTSMVGSTVTSPAVMSVKATSGNMIVPTYNPSDLHTFSTWVDNTISQHGKGKGSVIDFSTSSAHYDFSKSTYFKHTSWGVDLFFFSVGGSSTKTKTQVNVNTSSSEFSLKMSFDSVQEVQLSKGPWYDSSLMYNYKNNGQLSLPTSLLVAMYPSITLTMDSASYTNAYSAYTSSSGFGVGAFWVAAGGNSQSSSSTQMTADWDASSNSVTIKGTSILPTIIGMQVAEVSDTNVKSANGAALKEEPVAAY